MDVFFVKTFCTKLIVETRIFFKESLQTRMGKILFEFFFLFVARILKFCCKRTNIRNKVGMSNVEVCESCRAEENFFFMLTACNCLKRRLYTQKYR